MSEENREYGFFRKYLLFPLIYTIAGTAFGGVVVEMIKPIFAKSQLDADSKILLELVNKSIGLVDEITKSSPPSSIDEAQKLKATLEKIFNRSNMLSSSIKAIHEAELARQHYSLGADFYLFEGEAAKVGSGDNVFGFTRASDDNRSVLVSLNSGGGWVYPGQKLEFRSSGKGRCFISYMGKAPEAKAYGFGVGCSPDNK